METHRVGEAVSPENDTAPFPGIDNAARRPRSGGQPKPDPIELHFNLIFNALPQSYMIISPDFRVLGANDAFLKATFFRREELVGQPLFDGANFSTPDSHTIAIMRFKASLEKVIATRAIDRMPIARFDARRPDGSFEERYWQSQNSPVFDDKGILRYIVHHTEDVTAAVRLRELPMPEASSLNAVLIETLRIIGSSLSVPDAASLIARTEELRQAEMIEALRRRLAGLRILLGAMSEPLLKPIFELLALETEAEIAQLEGRENRTRH